MAIKILGVFDNDGESFDRYTVVFDDVSVSAVSGRRFHDALGLSDDPNSPQGFSQFRTCSFNPNGSNHHLGTKIGIDDLPEIVREHIYMRLGEE
ncbi:MAG: hypothetical protein P9L97_05790 [Candidatus Tenebribacter davisii]|nr:hypothetical protein [Candidatus Tenebribacter davisii]